MHNFIYFVIVNLLIAFTVFAQEAITTILTDNGNTLEITETGSSELQQQIQDKLYSRFNEDYAKTGILLDKSTFSSRIEQYSYKANSKRTINKRAFQDIYFGIYKSHLLTPKINKLFVTDSLLHSFLIKEKAIPIPILAYQYNKISKSAFQEKLLTIENDEFTFDESKLDEILETKNIFAATSWKKDIYNGSKVDFLLNEQFIFSNIEKKFDKIEIDFDDGLGYRKVSLNSYQTVNYKTLGEKTVKVRIVYTDQTIYESQFIENVVLLSTPTPEATWQLIADIPYLGQYALGEAYVWQSGTLNKPVVVIEGFDKDEDTGQEDLYALLSQQNLIETLRSWDYDIIVLNFNYSKDYIQRNAFLVAKLLHRVNLEKIGTEQLVLIGASMGGLVSRYALTYMEHNSMVHDVRTFISFDSPQNGANIPLGDQYWLRFFSSESGSAQDNFNNINSIAAKQMLLYHHTYFPYPNSYHTSLMNEISNLGDYPSNLRKVAVSNGNGTGSGIQLVDDYRLVYWRFRDFWVDIDGHTWAVPSDFSRKIFRGMLDIFGPSYRSEDITVTTQYSYDECPGGKSSTNGTIVEEIPNEYTPIKHTYNPDHGFIPMISALDLNTTNLNYNAAADPDILQKTPFDEVYFSLTNEDHVYISQNTYINMLNEITNFNLPPISVSISGPSSLGYNEEGTFTANLSYGSSTYTNYCWWSRDDNGFPPERTSFDNDLVDEAGNLIRRPPSNVWIEMTQWEGEHTITKSSSVDFSLKCEVTDSENNTATDIHSIIVSGGLAKAQDSKADISIVVVPERLELIGNYPNPFNPSTTIKFGLPEDSNVKLTIYSINGQKVISLADGLFSKGYHEVKWDGENQTGNSVSNGIYIYELKAGKHRLVKKMVFAK